MALDANAWTTVAAVKRAMKIDSSDTTYDAEIEDLINACYKMLEAYIHHPLKAADYTEYYDGDGTNTLVLRKYPINTVASIYDDVAREFGADSLIDSTDYLIDNDEEMGTVRLFQNTTIFARGIKNVKITYNAGYATIPKDAERACILLVIYYFNRQDAAGLNSQSMGGKSESYTDDALPMFIRQMVMKY
jgi:uncharacterized phiE125 gp8 family phage protein